MQKDKEYVSMQEFNLLRTEVEELARSVNTFVNHTSGYINVLLASATGQVPTKSISLETHNKVVKGIITAFSIIIIVSVGAVKILPAVLGNQH